MIELVDNNNGPACQTFRGARDETVGILADAGDGLGMIETLVGTASHNDTGVARQGVRATRFTMPGYHVLGLARRYVENT